MLETFVLPGFSLHNREWAHNIGKNLGSPTVVVEWLHWSGGEFIIQDEVQKFISEMNRQKINIIAKSIGTYVVALSLPSLKKQIDKLILCGVPLNDLSDHDKEAYKNLKLLWAGRVTCLQNSQDAHGSFAQVKHFLSQINPNFIVLEKPGDTHDYPYYAQFQKILA